MNNPKRAPIGWISTIAGLMKIVKDSWNSVMTIEHSPLKNLHPATAHMVFQALAFVWSALFAAMLGSVYAFGVSAILHVCIIAGITITAVTFRQAENSPESFKFHGYSGRGPGGEHE